MSGGVQIHGKTVLNNTDINNPDIDGGTANNQEIGTTTPAPGSFTTLRVSTDPVDSRYVGSRGFNDLRYVPKNLDATTSMDPDENEAVSREIVDKFGGVVISLTRRGNPQTLQRPSDPTFIKRFIVVTDDENRDHTIEVNGITMSAAEAQWFIWDGTAWIAIAAMDADDVAFTLTGGIIATTVQSAIAEVNTKKLEKADNLSDVFDAALSFGNIKQPASETDTGVIEKATTAEAVTGTDTDRAITPARLTSRMEEPGEIGGITPAAGNFTDMEISGEMQDDVDFAGKYTTRQQNILDLAAKGAGYWFDGVDDYIEVSDDTDINFGTNDFSVIVLMDSDSCNQSNQKILDKHSGWAIGNANQGYILGLAVNKVNFELPDGSARNGSLTPVNSIPDNFTKYSICTVRRIAAGGYVNIFINGKDQVLTQSTGTNFDDDVSNTTAMRIGHDNNSGRTLNGSLHNMKFFNMALSEDEVKALSSGAPVPYKYLGASQTNLEDNGEFTTNITGWSTGNYTQSRVDSSIDPGAASGGVDNWCLKGVAIAANSRSHSTVINAITGKKYRIKFRYYVPTGDPDVYVSFGSQPNLNDSILSGSISVKNSWSEIVIEFISTQNGNVTLHIGNFSVGGVIGDILYLDAVTFTQIGCVLQLEQPGIGHNQWLDTSGNELHGAVSGPIPINLEANHQEKIIKKSVTGDSLWTDIVPAGYILERLICEETAGNAAILDMGTSDGANDVFTGITIAASDITVIEINKMFSSSAAQTLDINDDQAGSSWNSASINITLICGRIQL